VPVCAWATPQAVISSALQRYKTDKTQARQMRADAMTLEQTGAAMLLLSACQMNWPRKSTER
jgi:ketopantoate hydroxymethyltransferase